MSKYQNIKIENLASKLKALSNPNRLKIFIRLVECCTDESCRIEDGQIPSCVGQLGKDLGIVPSTVSHHMKELRNADLIQMERKGQFIECKPNREALEQMRLFFKELSDLEIK